MAVIRTVPAQRLIGKGSTDSIHQPATPTPQQPVFINPTEAAAIIGFSHQTLAKWRMWKIGPKYSKLRNRIRYQKKHLIEFLESTLVDPEFKG